MHGSIRRKIALNSAKVDSAFGFFYYLKMKPHHKRLTSTPASVSLPNSSRPVNLPKNHSLIVFIGFLAIFFFSSLLNLAAQAQPQGYTLENGMTVILLPIESAENLSMGITFKGGAEAQTSTTAGMFNLLEQVLFRGRASEPGEPEPAGAIEALEASAFDGGAQIDRFSFALSLSPGYLAQGLNTLAYLFSGLRLETAFSDPRALETAKLAGIDRLEETKADPDTLFEYAMAKKLFSSAPWRLDALGSETVIRAATESTLKSLAARWLVPNNAALTLAGNFNPEETKSLVAASFASWKKAEDPLKNPPSPLPKPGVTRPTLMVYPDPSQRKGSAVLEMRYRGPDVASARSATAEVWAEMASQLKSKLSKALTKGMPKASEPSTIQARYHASKSASWFSVQTSIMVSGTANPADTVLAFKEIVRGTEMYAMKTNPNYFSADEFKDAKATLEKNAGSMDPQIAVEHLMDAWVLGGLKRLETVANARQAVTSKDIVAFADEYFMKNLEVIAIRLNPEDYAAKKKNFDAYGFELISPGNALWWKK